jgi:hypothetical protein
VIGDDEAEHGVAEELEPLVRLDRLGLLRAPGSVRDGALEQLDVAKGPADPFGELVDAR